jgi:glycine cleavage system H protein
MERHFPENLLYTEEHEWVLVQGDVVTIGITWHAQDALGDIVYCELPAPGEQVAAGQPFGVVESVKAVSDLFSPVTGEVLERNEDAYDDGWMIRVKMKDPNELDVLLSSAAYEEMLREDDE